MSKLASFVCDCDYWFFEFKDAKNRSNETVQKRYKEYILENMPPIAIQPKRTVLYLGENQINDVKLKYLYI